MKIEEYKKLDVDIPKARKEFKKLNKNDWLKQNFWHFEKIPKGCYNIMTQPRRIPFKIVNYNGINEEASNIFEFLLYHQGFITRGQIESIIKDIKEGKLK